MGPRGFDPRAVAGKRPEPDRHTQVLVVGAGPAGTAAAIEAARSGQSVLLIDENPIDAATMGLDAPLYFGGRYSGAVQNKARMIEQVFAANPALADAFEAGVEIALGVCCWGAWIPGENLVSLPSPVAGLADEERAWMVGFDRLILATGARDVVFSFEGWDQPGVMGAKALKSLIETYDAFAGRRLVILGSGSLALETALMARGAGLEVAALIEVEAQPQGPADLLDAVRGAGIAILTGHAPILAEGGVDGVEGLTVRRLADGAERTIDCDTIVQAISLTPVVELLDVLGGEIAMQPELGGHAPVSADLTSTSLDAVFLAGDVAGVRATPSDQVAYQQAWMRALLAAGDASVTICQCEAVTREALLAVRQPIYLGPPSTGMAARDLGRLLEDGPANPDQIKRLTRAGMGVCQGRRCREQVALALACASNQDAARVPMASYRAPVRPLPLKVLAAWDESKAIARNWDVWFGIPGQWAPYADIGTEREALYEGVFAADPNG